MAKMTENETKMCKIVPRKYRTIPDILPENRRIEETTTMRLNSREIMRAMADAEVYAVVGDKEVLLDPTNFDDHVEESTKEPEKEPEGDGDDSSVEVEVSQQSEDEDFPF